MRVLFIGGTGNLSADCAERVHALGHDVDIVTRGNTEVSAKFKSVLADRRDAAGLHEAIGRDWPEVVINFLGYDPADVQLDYELFRNRIVQYLFISSATVYAKPHPRLPVTEDAPLGNAYWDYAKKKLACEQWLLQRHRAEEFPVTVVRPSHTYSKRWVPNPISSSSYTYALRLERGQPVVVPDDGESPWTLTATEDFAVGLAGLVGNTPAVGEVFHITSDEALPWNDIAAEIGRAVGSASPDIVPIPTEFVSRLAPQMAGPWRGDKANPAVFDNSKIRQFVPGFVCRKPFRIGVRESVAWLRTHPQHQSLRPSVDALCDELVSCWRKELGRTADS